MKVDKTPGFERNFDRYRRDSMRGKLPDISLLSGRDQLPQEYEGPMVIIAVKCQRGRNFRSAYSDQKVLEMWEVAGIYEVRTDAYKKLLEKEKKQKQRVKKKAEAEAAIHAERQRKQVLIRAIKDREAEFDKLAKKAVVKSGEIDPTNIADDELDGLNLISHEVQAGSLIENT